MVWIIAPLAVIVAALLALIGVGLALPREHVAARRVRLRRPPEEAWARVRDHAAEPGWRSKLDRVERLPDEGGLERWKEVSGRSALTFDTLEADPARNPVGTIGKCQ